MSSMFGFQPLLAIFSHIFFIGVSFYALQAIMPEKIIRKNRVFQAQILFIFLSIMMGWSVSNFFLEISYWSGRLPTLFQ
ncbi:DUF1146 family protein [Sporosarcina pasteurii]|uniref:Conserved hypothetical integral membrane protein n=1 Tax=Sporosarcina pasteurii TaxID=1474 RepID=A0A380BEF5_SPOPA|nr:DUF1146 family protein [Sporosarcina pasteurii]MDS9472267.1 DUF1146 family protein [Sporosarcina pasteurii]QBQ06248.1 DUF1146 domain-containing protein [Sporosarcina pasteurii]SUI99111.1 conserved hypothetical integral membrane protein [Sporosarcina pasteurii]